MTNLSLRVRPDKIGSVCLPFNFGPYLNVRPNPECQEGAAIVARVITSRASYGELELMSGRLSRMVPGDIIVGALGNRAALRGFSGRVPQSLSTGDQIHLLNKGGVMGITDGDTVGLGTPILLEVLGTPLVNSKPALLADFALPLSPNPTQTAPIIAVIGTCMNSGKSTAASVAIRHFRSQGLRIHAGKATGVGAIADPLSFRDHGAAIALTFLDCGVPSTAYRTDIPQVFQTLTSHLYQDGPDLIIMELGDGVLGAYGVDEILDSNPPFTTSVIAANDVIGGYAVAQSLKAKGIPVSLVTGPATDNIAGVQKLEQLGIPAANILRDQAKYIEILTKDLGI